jgi:O-antigen/teichoic acid export membrane protein
MLVNVTTTGLVYIVTMGLAMIVRMFLNRTLGASAVGLVGVLTSVVTSLSLADLGVDSVFIYLLYRPIAMQAYDEIHALLRLFRRVYIIIGIIFIFAGILMLPFLNVIIGQQAMKIHNVRLIYLIFMLNSGISYFFAYYRTLLNADQRYYVISRVTFIYTLAQSVAQIILLLTVKSILAYVAMLLISTVAINLTLGIVAKKRYVTVGNLGSSKRKLDKQVVTTLIKNTVGGVSNKLGAIIVTSSDNILLANFVGLREVGMYSNYILITQGVSAFLSKIMASMTSTIGNLGTEQDERRTLDVFLRISFLMNGIVLVIAGPLCLVFSFFIGIWVGEESVLPISSVILIVVNMMLQLIRYPSLTFIDAFGLQWIQKMKSIVEAALNIIVSLILLRVFKLGLNGVLIGTLCSNLLVVNWYEPYIVLRNTCGRRYRAYFKQVVQMFLLLVAEILLAMWLLRLGWIEGLSIRSFTVIVIEFLFQCVFLVIIYQRDRFFNYYKKLVVRILKH